ncbi:MAG: hypothetical protein O3A51_06630 [Verrucomicrobia bacterium]|nr:hypothetical protein [Verrucomicrobiota bacterium]
MKRLPIGIALLLAIMMQPTFGAELFSIKAKQDRLDTRKGARQAVPRGTTQLESSTYRYVFTITRAALQPPDFAEAQWVIWVEDMTGRLRIASHGRQQFDPAAARQLEIETEDIELVERQWQGPKRQGALKESFYGYGIRIVGRDGDVLAERYNPSSAAKTVDWANVVKPDPPADQPKLPARLRKRFQPADAP